MRLARKLNSEDDPTPDRSIWELAVGAVTQLALLAALWVVADPDYVALIAGVLCAVFGLIALGSALHRSRIEKFGPANWVTLLRATLVGGVTMLVVDALVGGVPDTYIVSLAALALVLDAVDGQVARRTGTVTRFGARFDMEVDVVLILVLSVYVATFFGAWVVAIGAMRYIFVAFAWVAPWLRAQLPFSRARKNVAAIQGIVLVSTGSGLVPYPLAIAAIGAALALLVWSFGRDVLWLRRKHLRELQMDQRNETLRTGAEWSEITSSRTKAG